MFTIYIDDSGTSPTQHIAIATCLIIPARPIRRLEEEWNSFRIKEGFSVFHASEFVFRNPHSEFASWNGDKQERVFERVIQITRKYGAKAISISVNKVDYDEVIPDSIRDIVGRFHYSSAVHHLVSWLIKWKSEIAKGIPPFEFVFDWMDNGESKPEIIDAMDRVEFISIEDGKTKEFSNYRFGRRKDMPGLQCVDVVSWVCYQFSLFAFRKTPLHPFAERAWHDFEGDLEDKGWLWSAAVRRSHLQEWVSKILADPREMRRVAEQEKRRVARFSDRS